MLKYIVLVDWCVASTSPGGTLHMSMCVISACKSDFLSLHTCTVGNSEFTCVESSACVGCPHLFNL